MKTETSQTRRTISPKAAIICGGVLLGLSYLNYRLVMSRDFPDFMDHWWAFPVAVIETFAIIGMPFLLMFFMEHGRVAVFGRGMSSDEIDACMDELRLGCS